MQKQSILSSLRGIFSGSTSSNVTPTRTLGTMGVRMLDGIPDEDERNALLRGKVKYTTYSDILANTSIVAAGTRYFLNLLASAGWKAKPSERHENDAEKKKAEEYAKNIQYIMDDLETPWHSVVRRAAMYRFYGFSVQEWTAIKRKDGVIGIKDISPRAQSTIERWDVDEHGKITGVVQVAPQDMREIYLPRQKIIYIVDNSLHDSPEGMGLFRNVVSAAKRLERYEQLEGFGFETDLRGIPVVRIPYAALNQAVRNGQISEADANAAITRLESFVTKHIKNPQLGLALDSIPYTSADESQTPSMTKQFDVNLLEGGKSDFESVGAAIQRLNHEIARILGVEQLLLGQTRGTQALSEDKSQNFALIVDSSLKELQEVYEKDFVHRIFELNGWDVKLAPSMQTDKIQHRDIEQVGRVLADMASAGAILPPNDPAINAVRNQLGLPKALEITEASPALPRQPGDLDPFAEGLPITVGTGNSSISGNRIG